MHREVRLITVTDNNCDVWVKYLRCIDAQRLGTSRTPAAEIIFHEHKPKNEWDEPRHLSGWDSTKTKLEQHRSKHFIDFMTKLSF